MNSKTRSLLIGAIAGAVLGAAFAWVASSSSDEDGSSGAIETLGPTDYFQLGIGILNLARQFGSMLHKG
jgi:hypothetical protein